MYKYPIVIWCYFPAYYKTEVPVNIECYWMRLSRVAMKEEDVNIMWIRMIDIVWLESWRPESSFRVCLQFDSCEKEATWVKHLPYQRNMTGVRKIFPNACFLHRFDHVGRQTKTQTVSFNCIITLSERTALFLCRGQCTDEKLGRLSWWNYSSIFLPRVRIRTSNKHLGKLGPFIVKKKIMCLKDD